MAFAVQGIGNTTVDYVNAHGTSTPAGDIVELDVAGRKLDLKVSDKELGERRKQWKPNASKFERGYGKLFSEHIRQANEGCDFDFLEGTAPTPEPEIH
jgi:dihydroxy-acid dehydratase